MRKNNDTEDHNFREIIDYFKLSLDLYFAHVNAPMRAAAALVPDAEAEGWV